MPKVNTLVSSAADAVVTTAETEVVARIKADHIDGFAVWVENSGATNLSDFTVYGSADAAGALEAVLDTSLTTANGVSERVVISGSVPYVRVTATVGSSTTTVNVSITHLAYQQ
jgi:hypothetical protein